MACALEFFNVSPVAGHLDEVSDPAPNVEISYRTLPPFVVQADALAASDQPCPLHAFCPLHALLPLLHAL